MDSLIRDMLEATAKRNLWFPFRLLREIYRSISILSFSFDSFSINKDPGTYVSCLIQSRLHRYKYPTQNIKENHNRGKKTDTNLETLAEIVSPKFGFEKRVYDSEEANKDLEMAPKRLNKRREG